MPGHFLSRQERFAVVGSTNDVIRAWLAEGTEEVALAVADEQAQGRGREGRTWTAPKGAGLLLSLGFRPTWLAPDQAWRIAATASLAMAEAAEAAADLPNGTIRLKWPNDLVIDAPDGWLKLGGVLGETEGLGTADPRVVVGMGINADWAKADFPADIAAGMTSLREASKATEPHRTTCSRRSFRAWRPGSRPSAGASSWQGSGRRGRPPPAGASRSNCRTPRPRTSSPPASIPTRGRC